MNEVKGERTNTQKVCKIRTERPQENGGVQRLKRRRGEIGKRGGGSFLESNPKGARRMTGTITRKGDPLKSEGPSREPAWVGGM